ncbi:hypothetical protein BH23GEM9_BH23GEM9_27510 [soil metagenome]
MRVELIEHTVRLLKHAPTRSMPADALYERIRTEAGLDVGMSGLLDTVRGCPDRFAVLLAPFAVADQAGWHDGERSEYERALAAAGMSAPTVTLAERLCETDPALSRASPADCGLGDRPAGDDGAIDVFGAVHGALAELLHMALDDDMRAAVTGALTEMEAARRVLEDGS